MCFEQYVLLLLLLSFLSQLVLNSAQESKQGRNCSNFSCGWFEEVRFPFSNVDNPECGLSFMNCTEPDQPRVQFHENGQWYSVNYIEYSSQTISIHDQNLQNDLKSNRCDSLDSFPEKGSPFLSISVTEETRPFFKCKRDEGHPLPPSEFFKDFSSYSGCKNHDLYFYDDYKKSLPHLPTYMSNSCSVVRLPLAPNDYGNGIHELTTLWDAKFTIRWKVDRDCWHCHSKGGQCLSNQNGGFRCGNLKGLATGLSGIFVTCMVFIFFAYRRHKRNKLAASTGLISRSMSLDSSLKPDPEKGSTYFQTPIFTYKELQSHQHS
ncbi:hypothetical protein AQUCO_04100059v1 [Aquilegia coerulea]|uniref:Wall-associated receptor kinase galacturonan-binding domain-containing protein n=1 Tax=Aquilegia coerulea TaxID=218851 RepID=A0A2G5CQB0_AQUCA|nr:hypothetical protein AQUCO_04100059v1 [Aquilegia coerulea]